MANKKKKRVPLEIVREKKTPVTFRLEPLLLKRLRDYADREGTTMTAALEGFLAAGLEK